MNPFQKFILEQQFDYNEKWSFTKAKKLAKFLGLKPKQVYKWNYDRKMTFQRVREKIQSNKHNYGPLFYAVKQKRLKYEQIDDIIIFEVVKEKQEERDNCDGAQPL